MAVILHIVESFAGGVLTFLADLTAYQAARHDVYVLYGRREHTPDSLTGIFNPKVRLICASHFKGVVKTMLNPLSYAEIRHLVKELNPDIVHLHSSAAGFVGRMALRRRTGGVFYTPHGYSFLKMDSPAPMRKVYRTAERILAPRAVTVACGKGEYSESIALGAQAECVCNGITPAILDVFNSIGEKAVNERFTICTSGRIAFQKNPSLFNEIARRMPDCRFVWIGDGGMRDRLDAPNIEITGWKDRNGTLEAVAQSDAFIMTSLWEGFPISLLEAMYLSKPCVVNNVPGNRDILTEGESGFVCHGAEEFVSRLENLKRDDTLRRTMGEKARNTVASDYTFDKVADRYEKVYSKYGRDTQ